MNTHTGKIARLPRAVRDQLNARLRDGEPGQRLLEWLNALPEVQALVPTEFAGHHIRELNLTEWKEGGYRDWQLRQEELDMVRNLAADIGELKQATEEPLTETLALWVTARYAVAAKVLAAAGNDREAHWKLLRAFCNDIVALRKGDHSAENLKLERERLDLAEREHELKLKNKTEMALEALADELRGNPKLKTAYETFRDAVVKETADNG